MPPTTHKGKHATNNTHAHTVNMPTQSTCPHSQHAHTVNMPTKSTCPHSQHAAAAMHVVSNRLSVAQLHFALNKTRATHRIDPGAMGPPNSVLGSQATCSRACCAAGSLRHMLTVAWSIVSKGEAG